jgi:hypothetical protein
VEPVVLDASASDASIATRPAGGSSGEQIGNPVVRARKGMPEHVAWAYERPGGGRGFGFTGGHWQWNWAHDDVRKIVLNGIAWTAKIEIPEQGLATRTPTFDQLAAHQDYEKPEGFDKDAWVEKIRKWNAPRR